ncbi:hypothetical protein RN001_011425 [Aquatica leii]|uniref:Elongation of very long chain fatty acids protein n=1 Tax=Aquatica leii TaxID=1421715 RepID=A0AAN7P437_9COLE|nr:hypothetical protein RN001_011425 [Aquatica leii]
MSSSEAIPQCLHKYLGKPDPRVKEWFLLNSPINLIIIYSVYFTFLICGSKFMKNKNPLGLRKILVAYNFFQIVFSAYICKEICVSAYSLQHSLICTPLNTANNLSTLRLAKAFWIYYLSKAIDLIDTMFFVLRKKESQLTFLHIYHHTSMLFNWYIGVLYVPGGQATVSVGLNSFVHVIMYTYYMLSAMGPQVKKYLWWKKYLTQLQMIQFVLLIVHLVIGYRKGCHKPPWLVYFTVTYLFTMVFLFLKYYMHTYQIFYGGKKPAGVDTKAGGDTRHANKIK